MMNSDEYFMGIAFMNAMISEDPRTKVGACIVDKDGKVVGTGYNRMPKVSENCNDNYPWNYCETIHTDEEWMFSKYPYVVHAEIDAIMKKTCLSLEGCTMYSLICPGNESAKLIVNSGITRLVYFNDRYDKSKYMVTAKRIFRNAGVECVEFRRNDQNISFFNELAARTIPIDPQNRDNQSI